MEVLKNNKGLIMFYLFVAIFAILFTTKVEKDNDRLMQEKSAYLLNANV